MRSILALLLMAAMSGCAANSNSDIATCDGPRPQVCTMEYRPVCGQLLAGGERDYSSPCNACADDAVVSWAEGACGEEP